MQALNNVTTANGYTDGNTLTQKGTIKVNITVANAAIFYRFNDGGNNMITGQFKQEVYLPPGFYNFVRNCSQIQIRSAVTGTPAQVTVEALLASD